ncbi:MAG: glycosyltransferase family 2 protein [Caldiserica bacterium]|jgi:rhamnosyltransferase|nr:glycosyltransferase family 2 protein [Caldisericota bacterium]
MNSQSVCAVIVTYNGKEEIRENLKSIKDQVDHVLIVDNGSKSDTVSLIQNLQAADRNRVSLILNQSNLGVSAALNQGLRFAIDANFDWLLALDQDSQAMPRMVPQMLKHYAELSPNKQRRVAMLAPKIIEVNAPNSRSKIPIPQNPLTRITSGSLIRLSLIPNIGFFKEDLFIDSVDNEFCLRLNYLGYLIEYVSEACLLHRLGNLEQKSIFGRKFWVSNHSYIRRYYIARNRIYLIRLYWHIYPSWCWFEAVQMFKELIKIVIGEADKKRKLNATLKGLKDGMLNRLGKREFDDFN